MGVGCIQAELSDNVKDSRPVSRKLTDDSRIATRPTIWETNSRPENDLDVRVVEWCVPFGDLVSFGNSWVAVAFPRLESFVRRETGSYA